MIEGMVVYQMAVTYQTLTLHQLEIYTRLSENINAHRKIHAVIQFSSSAKLRRSSVLISILFMLL